MKKSVLCYTRKVLDEDIYSSKLANSFHIALVDEHQQIQIVNHNSGVLFVKAVENEDGTLCAKSIKKPYIFESRRGIYSIVAIRINAEGSNTEQHAEVVIFQTKDFLLYDEIAIVTLANHTSIEELYCKYDLEKDSYHIYWRDAHNNWYKNIYANNLVCATNILCNNTNELQMIEKDKDVDAFLCKETEVGNRNREIIECHDMCLGNYVEVSDATYEKIYRKLMVPKIINIDISGPVEIQSHKELGNIQVVASYSDGTAHVKKVNWNEDNIDWSKPGTYIVTGYTTGSSYEFPVTINRADPDAFYWEGQYYYIATNDADHNHTLYVRKVNTIGEIANAKEHLILDSVTYPHVGNLLWAPEFHEVEGNLYIFFATTKEEFFCEECHLMKLKKGGSPEKKEDWSEPVRITKADGTDLCEAGKTITLDMTCFYWNSKYYVIWSQRQFLPVDQGAWLYIAELDSEQPWKLKSEPVLLAKPEFGWENNHTFVVEGPFSLQHNGNLMVTYSAAAVDATYCVGLLILEGENPLEKSHWRKKNFPLLTSRSVVGEFGTGHNSYVYDENGDLWNFYHAKPGVNGPRSTGIRRVHFDADGEPVLDLIEEPQMVRVEVKLK